MRTIYRYEIDREINELSLPVGFSILSVGIVKRNTRSSNFFIGDIVVSKNPAVRMREGEQVIEDIKDDHYTFVSGGVLMFSHAQDYETVYKEKEKEVISLWAEVDNEPGLSTEKVKILVFGTGANLDSMTNFGYKYLGTIQKSTYYAFHVYQVTDDKPQL